MPIHPFRATPTCIFKIWNGLFRPVATVLLLASVGVACSLGRGTASPGSPTNTRTSPFIISTTGLEGLSSYRATIHLEFDGTKDGVPLAWSQDLQLESEKTASVRLLTIDRHGPDSSQDAAGMLIGQFGSMSLTRLAIDSACRAETNDTPLVIPEPASLLRPIQQPITFSSSPEEKNGVLALHTMLDNHALGTSPLAKVKGEIWVAKQGGYIVRYILEIDGTADDWGKGVEGVMRWEYNLDAVGQNLSLLPPPGCPLGMVDVPMPDDATQVETQPGVLTLTTGLDVAAAAEFYMDQLALQGWFKSDSNFLTPRAARLTFLRSGRQLVIRIQNDHPTQVWITLENPAAPQTIAITATPAGQADNHANEPMVRVVSCLNILLDGDGGTPAFPSYHLEAIHLKPSWTGEKLAQIQEEISADVQGKDVHFIDRKTAPDGSTKTAEAYLIGGQEYVVQDGKVQPPGISLISLAWTLWPLDPGIIISTGSTGAKAASMEELGGRSVEVYELNGTGSPLAGVSGLGLPVTSVSGKVWIDQETGALLKAALDYQADVNDSSGNLKGNGSGRLEITVTEVGNVNVVLPNQ